MDMADEGKTSEFKLSLELDEKKIEEIKRCLEKGRLTITVASIDKLVGGRAANGYLYD
jgi:anti-sigma28 factor (negative regulator of flagellin synthesis)